MRSTASIMHLDLDAFFASVEQRDKPSLRGKPVIVGGIGPRGVVATASYEARVHGVRSAMRTAEARARCPHAAFLGGRFDAYREASLLVMTRLREASPLVEPLSLDEAFVDLAAGPDFDPDAVEQTVADIRRDIADLTGGLTASVGVASSKLMAKIASEINKPNGVFVVAPGTEADVLGPDAGDGDPRSRSGDGRASSGASASRRSRTSAPPARTSSYACSASRPVARSFDWRAPRTSEPSSRPRDQVGQRRGHLRARHLRPRSARGHRRPHGPVGLGPAAQERAVGSHRDAQAAAPRLRDPHALVDPGQPDRQRPHPRRDGTSAARGRGREQRTAPARRRRQRARRLGPGGPLRVRGRRRRGGRSRRGGRGCAPNPLLSRDGRAPRRARRRMGLGRWARPGHRTVRDPPHSTGSGPHLQGR